MYRKASMHVRWAAHENCNGTGAAGSYIYKSKDNVQYMFVFMTDSGIIPLLPVLLFHLSPYLYFISFSHLGCYIPLPSTVSSTSSKSTHQCYRICFHWLYYHEIVRENSPNTHNNTVKYRFTKAGNWKPLNCYEFHSKEIDVPIIQPMSVLEGVINEEKTI